MINIIREDSRINTQLTSFPAANVNVAIFGTQSSGKSTLLNHVFDTKFPVLNTQITRQRCTKGIWFQNISNMNVIDTQGFDSVERTQQQRMFQKQVALFCLALSDVLIINLWMNQIGRYEASHSHILKAIIRASERVIASQQRKIIFVVRDCTDDADRSILKQQLSSHMMGIVKAQTQKSTLKFSLQYFMMSHIFDKQKQFKKEAKQLLKLISTTKKSNLSNYSNQDRLVYVKNLWQKISSEDSDIDLRTIQDSLRAYVLERIKKQAIFHMQQWVQNIQDLSQLKTYQRYIQAAKKQSRSFYLNNKPRHLKQKQVQIYVAAIDQSIEIKLNKHFMSFLLPNQEDKLVISNYSQKLDSFQKTNSNDFRKKMQKLRRQITQIYRNIVKDLRQHAKMTRRFQQKIQVQNRKYEQYIEHLQNVFKVQLQGALNQQLDKQTKNLQFDQKHIKKIISIMQQKHDCIAQAYLHDIWDRIIQRTSKSTLVDRIKSQGEQYSTASLSFILGNQDQQIINTYRSLQRNAEKYLSQILKFNSTQQDLTLNLQKFEEIRKLINDLIDRKLIQQAKRFKITLVVLTVILIFFYSEFKVILNVFGLSKKRIKRWLTLYILTMLTSISILVYRNKQTIKSLYQKYLQS